MSYTNIGSIGDVAATKSDFGTQPVPPELELTAEIERFIDDPYGHPGFALYRDRILPGAELATVVEAGCPAGHILVGLPSGPNEVQTTCLRPEGMRAMVDDLVAGVDEGSLPLREELFVRPASVSAGGGYSAMTLALAVAGGAALAAASVYALTRK